MKHSSKRLAFKYRSGAPETLQRDLQALRDATFYAAARASLNDPFEGRFDRSTLDRQFSLIRRVATKIAPGIEGSFDAVSEATDELLGFVNESGIFSLSYNPLKELIWAHYGGAHCG